MKFMAFGVCLCLAWPRRRQSPAAAAPLKIDIGHSRLDRERILAAGEKGI